MKNEEVRPYYEALRRHRFGLLLKRLFDIVVSLVMLILLSPILLILAIIIKVEDPGPVFYRQVRITQYGKPFRIFKYRTMIVDADQVGAQVTSLNDPRITKIGKTLRRYRLDELPQLFNVLAGDMSFVGTRPEVPKYVDAYTAEMMATLLVPAGVTSEASIRYKDEDKLIGEAEDPDKLYIEEILPVKMKYNLEQLRSFSLWNEFKMLFRTVGAVFGGE